MSKDINKNDVLPVCLTQGSGSHAEGDSTNARGNYSHAEGFATTTIGNYSHAEGIGTIAKNCGEHAEGTYNMSIANHIGNKVTLFTVGNGKNDRMRSNAFTVMENGDVYIQGIDKCGDETLDFSHSVQELFRCLSDDIDNIQKELGELKNELRRRK